MTLKRQAQIANTISIASLLAIAGVGLWGVEGTPPARAVRVASAAGMEPVSLVDAPTLGNPSAPLALVMFSDFQCPYCRAFARATLPVVIERYVRPGKLLLAFKHFPLDIHGDARRAAELADCARRKARFWELHDAIFRDTAGFEGDWLTRVATMAGMPPAFFADCPFSAAAERVNQDVAVGAVLDISSTPTILIGPVIGGGTVKVTRVLEGVSPPDALGREIDDLLQRQVPVRAP